jgi:aminoglycoside phosphotransferase (APT) family kinase protein
VPDATVAEKLRELLAQELGVPVAYAEEPVPLAGGFSNEIFRFQLAHGPPGFDGPLVLRLAHDDHDVAREAIVQDGVARAGYPAPAVLLHGPRNGLRAPFIVTPLVPGIEFDQMLSLRTALPLFRRLPAQLAGTMADLHDVPTAPITDELARAGWTAERLGSVGVLADVAALAAERDEPSVAPGLRWLHAHIPDFAPAVVCHGDLHPLNLLFDGDRISAVLDWELARLADPAYDVARTVTLLAMAPYPMKKPVRRLVQPITRRLANSFVSHYRKRRALDDASLHWHEALHVLRTLTITLAGQRQPEGNRLRRTAEVWLPVAPYLCTRFTALTGVPIANPRSTLGT